MRQEWDEKSIRRKRSIKISFSRRDAYLKREATFRKRYGILIFLKDQGYCQWSYQLLIQTFLHRCCSFAFSVFKILYDLNVFFDFFQYIILNQLRLEEVIVGKKFSGFRQPMPQILDPGPQDQTLRHFSYQSFIFM